jgi:septal ring factor EnvC (AmiA/AmiB activator)
LSVALFLYVLGVFFIKTTRENQIDIVTTVRINKQNADFVKDLKKIRSFSAWVNDKIQYELMNTSKSLKKIIKDEELELQKKTSKIEQLKTKVKKLEMEEKNKKERITQMYSEVSIF